MLTQTESRGLALARGFIVFIMPAVHTVLIYSSDTVKTGWLGAVLGFLAEQPGAQLFMLQMGLFIGIGKQKAFKTILKRFITLFVAGYLLNFLRLVLPYWWGGLPDNFLKHNNIPHNRQTSFYLLLAADILQFAALGYLFAQAVRYWLKPLYLKIILLAIIICIAPFTWDWQPQRLPLQYISGLVNGLPPIAFFPFFPWICYVVSGLIMAQVLQHYHRRFKLFSWFIIAVALIAMGITISFIEPAEWHANFYRLGIGGTIFHIGAAIAWIALFICLVKKIRINICFSFIEGLSSRITSIYVLQWIIIIWLIPLFGFNKLGPGLSLVAIAVNAISSFSLAYYLPYQFESLKYRQLK